MLEKKPGDDLERLRAAEAALGEVRPGMKLGLGTGRTADHFVRLLGEKVRAGLAVAGVPHKQGGVLEALDYLASGEKSQPIPRAAAKSA